MKFIFLVVVVFYSTFTSAGVFKCTSENGQTTYQTSPCAVEKNATEFNITAGSHTKLSTAKQKSAMILHRQQQEEQEKKLAQLKIKQQQEQLKKDALLESMKNQLHIKNNASRFSPFAIPPYTEGKRPPVVEIFKSRLPEIERYRRQAAEVALAKGDCGRVEGTELNIKSKQDNLNFFVECSSGKKVYLSEQELNTQP
jgi:hypothetical protein